MTETTMTPAQQVLADRYSRGYDRHEPDQAVVDAFAGTIPETATDEQLRKALNNLMGMLRSGTHAKNATDGGYSTLETTAAMCDEIVSRLS